MGWRRLEKRELMRENSTGVRRNGPAQAQPLGRVVLNPPVGVAPGDGAIDLALVDELGGEDRAVGGLLPMPEFFLVDDGEAVAAAELLREVDIPAEDFHQPQDQPLGHAGGEAVLEQGRFDRAAGVCRPGFIQPWLLQDAEACVRALQVQGRVLARIRGELLQPAFVVCLQSQHLAGLDLMEQARLGVTADVLQQAGVVYPGTL